MSLFGTIYNISTYVLAAAWLPKLLYQRARHGKYKESLSQRLGRQFPAIPKRSGPKIWVHAVSMGETKAVAPLIRKLREQYPEASIVLSAITETGHQEGKRSAPEADAHVFLPFDFAPVVKGVLRQFSPDLVVLCETDIWYNFLSQAKKGGAQIALVNGKVSERSQRRLACLPWLSAQLYGNLDLLCLQGEVYRDRFASLGVPESKMHVTGNLKFDGSSKELSADEKCQLREQLGIQGGDLVLTLASTHDPEESLLLEAIRPVMERHPKLKLLVVPRHPERFDTVAGLIPEAHRYSTGANSEGKRVVLVDAMGVLKNCFQVSDLAIVCGSYTEKVGGHNILEPCEFAVPTLFGPHMHAQPELAESVLAAEAALQVPTEELGATLEQLITNPSQRAALGSAGQAFARSQQGATQRSFQLLTSYCLWD